MAGKKRSVQRDYRFYDPPNIVWDKMNSDVWQYKRKPEYYHNRDLALMGILYLSCSRIVEIVGGTTKVGILEGVKKSQFVEVGNFLMLRNVPVVKQRHYKVGKVWNKVENPSDYPKREEIDMPLKGDLSSFTEPIVEHLKMCSEDEEVFPISSTRGWQIVNHCSGEFPHYLRDMGLKLRLRLFGLHIGQLQEFSGHRKLERLIDYLGEAEREQGRRRMIRFSFNSKAA
jgi:hypothetical protein